MENKITYKYAIYSNRFVAKDTKNRRTWWCLIAPIRPKMEMTIKNIPHARIPPIIGKFVPIAEDLP